MQDRTFGRALGAVALGLSLVLASAAFAEEAYPTHPVRMLAASAPGGNPDVLARLLANRLSEMLGAAFIVEDVPGAGGVLAAKQEAAAKPDGYTLGVNDTGALAINIVMNPDATYRIDD
jgi:tripartite-type tricarboxylate transporter receptor subunit TctC